jgi:electron transfer flavoprotein alpha subunit
MGILAILEQRDGVWNRLSFETLAAAQQLGRELGLAVTAAVGGRGAAPLAAEAAAHALDRVWAVEHELLGEYTAGGYTSAFEQLVRRAAPAFVLLPHTYRTRDFGPALAARFGRVLVSDVVGHRIEGGVPVFVRQLFLGKLHAEVRSIAPAPHFASLQAGAWRADAATAGSAPVESFVPTLDAAIAGARPGERFRPATESVDLASAGIVVSVGRGIGGQDNLAVVEALAQALGAELAASRPVCDNGWLPVERQVGSSGQTVAPKLYVAVGISGAIQHLVGMKGSRIIVAINKDPGAPIFEVADYGIVGDLFEVVPALVEELRKAKG